MVQKRRKVMVDQEAVFKVFEKVLANKDAAKEALKNPGKVLSQHGLAISDEEIFNSVFFDISPSIRKHLVAASAGKSHGDLVGCESPKCIACQTTLAASIGAAVAACIGSGAEGACVETIVAATGLSATAVIAIIAGGGGAVAVVIKDLCKAMKLC
jgi:hypothetical protein